MNTLTIPPSTNWYLPNIIACTPDNTVIYGSRSNIAIIYNEKNEPDSPASVKLISRAHLQKIISVGVNKNWGKPNKYVVSVSEDKIIKLWNFDTFERKLVNVSFTKQNSPVLGAAFAGDDRIVCVTEEGAISIWNIVLNEETHLRNDLFKKVTVTSFSICPHASYLGAFGMKCGLVFVVDLRREGKVVHKLRGHDTSIVSLVWCPVPINVFPEKPNNYVIQYEKRQEAKEESGETVEIKEVEDVVEKTEEEPEKPKEESPTPQKKLQKSNPWVNLVHADDEDQKNAPTEEILKDGTNVNDFLSECRRLKEQILNIKSELNDSPTEDATEDETTEEAKQTTADVSEEPENAVTIENKTESDESSPQGEKTRTILPKSEPEVPRKEYLLATSAKESKIYIWRAWTDGRMQTFFVLPNKKNFRRGKPVDKTWTWTALCWPNPQTMFVASKTGELLSCQLPRSKCADKQFTTVHKDHNSNVLFNIVAPQVHYTETDYVPEDLVKNVWTVAHDHQLLNTNIETKEKHTLSCYPTMSAGTTVLESSPLDPTRVAIGTSDGTILIWDLSRPHTNCIEMQRFHQKIMSKVNTLAWHPTHEVSLAFGTIEGRIGVVDVSNPSKRPTLMPNYFNDVIHHVEFGPFGGDLNEIALYATSEGKLAVFNMKKTEVAPSFIELPEGLSVYRFTWHPNRKYLVVNTKTGSILIFSTDLTLISTLYEQIKCYTFAWHPDSFNLSGDSMYKDRFAVATNSELHVYDLKEDEEGKMSILNACKFVNGHCDRINGIAWCPFNSRKIVSVGDDGFAQVWDIETKAIISTYVNVDYYAINAVLWSTVSEDYIILGNRNHIIQVYNVNEYEANESFENLVVSRKKALKKISTESAYGTKEKKVAEKATKPTKACLLPTFYGEGEEKNVVGDMKALFSWKKTGEGGGTNGKFGIFNVFGDFDDMMKLLDFNEKAHTSKGKHNYSGFISLFKGDLNNFIKEAIQEKRVTPWIISVAPMASHNLWMSACETYAEQLMEEVQQDPLQVVTYLLITHKTDQALEYLCDKQMFREALALSKARKCDSDVINEIITKYAKHLVFTGMFELAAQCYIYLGQFEQAASVLFRRTDVSLLEFACELALECKNDELYKAIKFRYESFKEAEDKEGTPEPEEEIVSGEKEEVASPEIEEIVTNEEEEIVSTEKPEVASPEKEENLPAEETNEEE